MAIALSPATLFGQKNKIKKDKTTSREDYYDRVFLEASKAKMLGEADLSLNNVEKAVELFERCTKLNKKEPAAYFQLAQLYIQLGRKKDAIDAAEEAHSLDASNFWYHHIYIEALQHSQQFEKSVAELQKLIDKYPHKDALYYELGSSYKQLGEYKKAIEVYDQLEERLGIDLKISIEKQQAYHRLNDLEGIAGELNKLIEAYPETYEYRIQLALLYLENGESKKADEVYQQLAEDFENDPNVGLAMFQFYMKKGEEKKAYDHLKTAFASPAVDIDKKVQLLLSMFSSVNKKPELKGDLEEMCQLMTEAHPEDARAYTIYGDFLYQQNEMEKALEQFKLALKYDKSRYAIWNQVFILQADLNRIDSLLKYSKDARSLFPNQPLAYYFEGFGQMQQKKYPEAVTALTDGIELIVDNKGLLVQFYLSLSEAFHQQELHASSDSVFEVILSIDPVNSIALNNYSYYLSLRNENLEKAEKMSFKSNQLNENQPTYMDTYAWVLYKMGKYEDAKEWIHRAMDNGGGGNAEILEHCGDIYFKLGDKKKAKEFWEKAAEKLPENEMNESLQKKLKTGNLDD